MNKISIVTRRNIFDVISISKIYWSGRLEETAFLSRIFDLSQLPSSDYRFENALGDIRQHRINNYDWSDDWIFTDSRFNLLHCKDEIFLRFLCEMLHPVVRSEELEIKELLKIFNENLLQDRFEIFENQKISGKPAFKYREIIADNKIICKINTDIAKVLNSEYINQKIQRMQKSLDDDPNLAIGTAKELIESICKTILFQRKKEFDKNWDIPRLVKETSKELKLTPKDIPAEAKAFETIKIILDSLAKVINGINELRNNYGTGHGKDAEFKGLSSRHAKLATGAASTLAIFFLETHEIR